MSTPIGGVCSAVLTPLTAELEPDAAAAIPYYQGLLSAGCDALIVLGTTGEAMSLSTPQRRAFMEALAQSDLPCSRIVVGTGGCAAADAIELTHAAREYGFGGALILPPFFFRGVTETQTMGFYDRVFTHAEPAARSIYLYHFPKVSGVPFTPPLVARMMAEYGEVIAGLKDSSNDLPFVSALVRDHPELDVFVSSEAHLAFARDNGLAGCISARIALWPHLARAAWHGKGDAASQARVRLRALHDVFEGADLIAAVRALTATAEKDDGWNRLLPPLRALAPAARAALVERAASAGYALEART